MDVSVIIVNYNTKDLLKDCLNSIYSQTKDLNFEVIVSDNGSVDGSNEMVEKEFPQVVLIKNNANLGFGAANNRGLKVARGKYIFYLNSDTILLNNAIKIFFDFWESSQDKNIGALGAILYDKNMKVIHSGGEYPSYNFVLKNLIKIILGESLFGRFLKKIKNKNGKKTEIYESGLYNGYITGADLFLVNNEFAKFDENYFMYFEETDLQYNGVYKRNLNCFLLDEPKIIHLWGGSSGGNNQQSRFVKKSDSYNWQSAIKYLRKNCKSSNYKINLIKIIVIFVYVLHYKQCKIYIKALREC